MLVPIMGLEETQPQEFVSLAQHSLLLHQPSLATDEVREGAHLLTQGAALLIYVLFYLFVIGVAGFVSVI